MKLIRNLDISLQTRYLPSCSPNILAKKFTHGKGVLNSPQKGGFNWIWDHEVLKVSDLCYPWAEVTSLLEPAEEQGSFKLLLSRLRDYQLFSCPCKSSCCGKESQNPAGIWVLWFGRYCQRNGKNGTKREILCWEMSNKQISLEPNSLKPWVDVPGGAPGCADNMMGSPSKAWTPPSVQQVIGTNK